VTASRVPLVVAGSATCRHCGREAAAGAPFIGSDGGCCEACHWTRRHPSPATSLEDGTYSRFVEALVDVLDLRERETGLHSRRAACHTLLLARRTISNVAQLRQIYWGSLLHDIGKIGIPDRILLKQGELSAEEWDVMRTHVELGYQIVGNLPEMADAAQIVRCHEERHDGTGYPRGLAGEQIPFGARLFAVIDTLDAMTSDRPYRKALAFDGAKDEIVRMSGTQFAPEAVAAFLAEETALREMVALKCHASVPTERQT
jgi:HD-GYP domain-containing protein (c-di-GMP phosphodiesterase class II)